MTTSGEEQLAPIRSPDGEIRHSNGGLQQTCFMILFFEICSVERFKWCFVFVVSSPVRGDETVGVPGVLESSFKLLQGPG